MEKLSFSERVEKRSKEIREERKQVAYKWLFYIMVFVYLSAYFLSVVSKVESKANSIDENVNLEQLNHNQFVGTPYNTLSEAKAYQEKYFELKEKYGNDKKKLLDEYTKMQDSAILENAKAIIKPEVISYDGEYTITAYCPCEKCCGEYSITNHGIGSSGNVLKANHSVASSLPEGTKIMINNKLYVVEDKPSDFICERYNNKIVDIYFDDHQEALNFGKQKQDVYIIKEGKFDI